MRASNDTQRERKSWGSLGKFILFIQFYVIKMMNKIHNNLVYADGSWPRRSGMTRARLDIPYGNSARERPASPRLPQEQAANPTQEEAAPKPK